MITNATSGCCNPQTLKLNNSTGYLSISDGNKVYLGTVIESLGIKTPVLDFVLQGYVSTLTYTDANGNITSKQIDLSALALGGSFAVQDTATLHLNYAAALLQGDVKISATGGNSIISNLDGIYSPTFTETPITVSASSTILITPSGTDGHNLTASVIISSGGTNQLSIAGDGLFVPDMRTYILQGTNISITGSGTILDPYVVASSQSFTQTPISVINTPTISFATSGLNNHTITGNVNVSASGGNSITINPDGIYSPVAATFTVAQARASISANAPLAYNSSTGVLSIQQSSTSLDGFISSTDWNTFNTKIGSASAVGTGAPVYAGVTGTNLKFNNILAGTNVAVTPVGNDIVISATSTAIPTSVSELFFIVGDGGANTPANGASFFTNPLLVGKTIIGMWVEGVKIAPVLRSGGNMYFTFASGSGQVTLTNGTYDTDGYYSIIYK